MFFTRRVVSPHASAGRRFCGKPIGVLPVRGDGSAAEGAQRGEALLSASAAGARGGGAEAGLQLELRGGTRGEDLPQNKRRGTGGGRGDVQQ